jgi:ATP-dependent Lon protease
LAKVLGLHFHDENCGTITAGFILKGGHASWTSAEPGLIARLLAQSPTCCPVFLLDEIDKLGGGDHRFPVMPALLSLLEPSSSAKLRDEFCRGTFDASRVFYIATANSLGSVPLPLLSRFQVVEITKPSADQRLTVVKNIMASEHPYVDIAEDVLMQVARSNLDFRDFKNRLNRVVALAIRRHRGQCGLDGVLDGTIRIEVTRFDVSASGVDFKMDI